MGVTARPARQLDRPATDARTATSSPPPARTATPPTRRCPRRRRRSWAAWPASATRSPTARSPIRTTTDEHHLRGEPVRYNSLVDFQDNMRSVQNAYLGSVPEAGTSGKGLTAFVASVDPTLDARVKTEIQAAIDAHRRDPGALPDGHQEPRRLRRNRGGPGGDPHAAGDARGRRHRRAHEVAGVDRSNATDLESRSNAMGTRNATLVGGLAGLLGLVALGCSGEGHADLDPRAGGDTTVDDRSSNAYANAGGEPRRRGARAAPGRRRRLRGQVRQRAGSGEPRPGARLQQRVVRVVPSRRRPRHARRRRRPAALAAAGAREPAREQGEPAVPGGSVPVPGLGQPAPGPGDLRLRSRGHRGARLGRPGGRFGDGATYSLRAPRVDYPARPTARRFPPRP